MKNMSHRWYQESYVQSCTKFHEVALYTYENEKVCSWPYLLKNNKVQQFVKFLISSTLHTNVCNLSRPDKKNAFK